MTKLSCYYSRWEIPVVAPYATGILKDTIIPIIEAKPKLKTACFVIWTGINQDRVCHNFRRIRQRSINI
jgi:hypothetical protein